MEEGCVGPYWHWQRRDSIDLVADGGLAATKARDRIRSIERERTEVETRLSGITDDLSRGADFIRGWLKLLSEPHELYLAASNEMRRKLNQAIFKRIWILDAEHADSELSEPARMLLDAQLQWIESIAAETKPLPTDVRSGSEHLTMEDLLEPMDLDLGSSKRSMVPPTGIEPATFGTGNQRSIP